jgi:DNA invertase Pin-like site-specific DNA recombinase
MIYGYARVSTEAQDLANQRAQLTAAGCERIFSDKLTGTNADRPQLKRLMAGLEPGDMVIIPAVDRMARNPTDLLVLAREIDTAGAVLRSLAEPIIDTGSDFKEIVLAVFGVVAKLEHRRIIDRTTRGRAAAKARGVIFGRKPKLTAHQQREARARLAKGDESVRAIALSYGVSHSTISRLHQPEGDA